jgi:hypothetical protein
MNPRDIPQFREKVIQDVYLPDEIYRRNRHVANYLHTAIGELAARLNKRRQPRRKKPVYFTTDALVVPKKAFSPKPFNYTVIEPLSAWRLQREPALSPGAYIKLYGSYAVMRLKFMMRNLSAAGTEQTEVGWDKARKRAFIPVWGTLRGLPWLPKNYSLSRGQYTDWHRRTFVRAKRIGLPLIGTLAVVLLAVLVWPLPGLGPIIWHHRPPAAEVRAAQVTPQGASGSNSNKHSSSTGSTSTPLVTSVPTLSGAKLVGGQGGGVDASAPAAAAVPVQGIPQTSLAAPVPATTSPVATPVPTPSAPSPPAGPSPVPIQGLPATGTGGTIPVTLPVNIATP